MNGGYGGCARTAPSEGRRHDHQATNPENVRDYIRSLEDLLSGRLPKTPSSAKRIARGEKVTAICPSGVHPNRTSGPTR